MKLCPKCRSENIVQDASILTGQYHCRRCGYMGVLVIEKFNESKEQR